MSKHNYNDIQKFDDSKNMANYNNNNELVKYGQNHDKPAKRTNRSNQKSIWESSAIQTSSYWLFAAFIAIILLFIGSFLIETVINTLFGLKSKMIVIATTIAMCGGFILILKIWWDCSGLMKPNVKAFSKAISNNDYQQGGINLLFLSVSAILLLGFGFSISHLFNKNIETLTATIVRTNMIASIDAMIDADTINYKDYEDTRFLASIFGGQKNNVSTMKIHHVQPTENLTTIASKYNVKVQEIATLNRLVSDKISAGMFLKIPKLKANISTPNIQACE